METGSIDIRSTGVAVGKDLMVVGSPHFAGGIISVVEDKMIIHHIFAAALIDNINSEIIDIAGDITDIAALIVRKGYVKVILCNCSISIEDILEGLPRGSLVKDKASL